MGDQAFGHVGAGGSIGFADPECRLGFGYSMTKMGEGMMLNERGQTLVDTAYKTLGYRTNAPGHWVKKVKTKIMQRNAPHCCKLGGVGMYSSTIKMQVVCLRSANIYDPGFIIISLSLLFCR
jgi:hypothetical protein